jgi:hypothetical protein
LAAADEPEPNERGRAPRTLPGEVDHALVGAAQSLGREFRSNRRADGCDQHLARGEDDDGGHERGEAREREQDCECSPLQDGPECEDVPAAPPGRPTRDRVLEDGHEDRVDPEHESPRDDREAALFVQEDGKRFLEERIGEGRDCRPEGQDKEEAIAQSLPETGR